MDLQTVMQIISNLGFPVACVIALFWEWEKERTSHQEELKQITTALNNNTQALIKIEEFVRNAFKS